MSEFLSFLMDNIRLVRITDVLDIAIVSYAIYKCVMLIKETRAAQLIKGVIVLVILLQLSGWMKLNATNYILSNTISANTPTCIVFDSI